MAEPLKNQYGPEIPRTIATMIANVMPSFRRDAFLRDVLEGYEALELMPRGRKISRALRDHLPRHFPEAIDVLLASLGSRVNPLEGQGMAAFLYMPHTNFVADYGLDHFEESMHAQHELTQLFTAEFSIRPFLERHTERTLARLRQWTEDPNPHVRRLVSEGTRPRLPWAPRLRMFQKDPRPVLALLDLLKDDPELYVRRSVANNLNDIGKDHPAVLVATAKSWMKGASEDRAWIVRHALRSAVKRGDAGALSVMGFGGEAHVRLARVSIAPKRVTRGGKVRVSFDVVNDKDRTQRVLVDFRVHFVKSGGRTSPKVFKLKQADLAPRESMHVTKLVSLADLTTRRHYEGRHVVEAIINGRTRRLGAFDLRDRSCS